MSSADLLRSTISRAAFTDGTNPSTVLRFTTGAANVSSAVPRTAVNDWRGAEVEIKNESVVAGDIVWFTFSPDAGVVLVIDVPAAGGDPKATRGEPIFPGERIRRRIPASKIQPGDIFFNRIASANTPSISMVRIG
jgi:hypothetical protein